MQIYVAVTEIWTLNSENWIFSPDMCHLFSGTEVLTNTSTTYLLICFSFHVLSLFNLHVFEKQKTSKNPLTSYSDSESNECLMTKPETSANRAVTIDYRKRKSDVSVIFPAMLVWFVSLSLSIPEYTISSIVRVNSNVTLCSIVDVNFGQIMQNLLLVFRVVIPAPLFILCVFLLGIKFCRTRLSKDNSGDILTKKSFKIESLLIFSLALCFVHILTSFQRDVLYLLHVWSQKFDVENLTSFMMPPLHNTHLNNRQRTYLSMLHYSGGIFRPVLYVFLLPKFRFLVRSKLLLLNTKRGAEK